MNQVIGLYGKTWHFWQVDRGDKLPLGYPKLTGILSEANQLNLEQVMKERNEVYGVDLAKKQKLREGIKPEGIYKNADSWWKGIGPSRPDVNTWWRSAGSRRIGIAYPDKSTLSGNIVLHRMLALVTEESVDALCCMSLVLHEIALLC
jgi:Protein of unknown function (DUF1264)